jgi:hypothetical protein
MNITLRLSPFALSLALVACNSQVGALVRVTDLAPGSTCAAGGEAIESGFDKNANGALDDDEVDASKTHVLCKGTPGPNGLPGMNGANGDAGANAPASLTHVTSEPAGANCKYGGARVDTGLDLNGDGVLQSAEVTGTHYLCTSSNINAWYFGDVHLAVPGDLTILDGVQVLIGSLYFDGPCGTDVTLPDLQVVSQSVYMTAGRGGGGARPVHTPGIVGLNSVTFPALTRVGGNFDIDNQEDLSTISAPKLVTAGYVEFYYNARLKTVDLPSLTSVPGNSVNLYSNDALSDLRLPKLARLDSLRASYNTKLGSLDLPALTTINSMEVSNNPNLTSLTIPHVVVRSALSIRSNPNLAGCPFYHLVLPHPPSLDITNNADVCTGFDQCDVVPIPGIGATVRSCFRAMDYSSAQALCRTLDVLPDGGSSNLDGGLGSNLVWFETHDEWVGFQVAAADGGGFPSVVNYNLWLGYSDQVTEGTWLAESGFTGYTPMTDTDAGFWNAGEPNNSLGAENWSEYYTEGVANDTVSTTPDFPVCRTP